MLILSFLNIIFSTIQPHTNTHLVYVYYNRPDLQCPLCTLFNNKIYSLPLPITKINFYDTPLLASHYYVREFPTFIMRHNRKSYYIKADTIEELFSTIKSLAWLRNPTFYLFEPDTLFTRVYAHFYLVFYYFVEYTVKAVEGVPTWVVNTIMTFIIAYLVISIVGIFKTNKNM